MLQQHPPTAVTRAYLTLISVVGMTVVSGSVYKVWSHPVDPQWFLLAALTLISGAATVKLPSVPATISVSEVFVFISVLLFGVPAGTLIVTLDALVIALRLSPDIRVPRRVLFNVSTTALSCWAGGTVCFQAFHLCSVKRSESQISFLLWSHLR